MSENPVIVTINNDLLHTASLAGFNRADVLDEWFATLSAAAELEGDAGLPPLDSTTLYLDSLGEPHWTATGAEIERWQDNNIKYTTEALEYVKTLQEEAQNGN